MQTDLTDVRLTLPPTTWMGPGDSARVRRWHDAYARLGGGPLGGSDWSRAIVDAMTPAPLRLGGVDARFVFTEDRVTIERLLARLDDNAVRVSGHIDGYTADAGVDLRLESLPGQRIVLNPSPAFLPAMPWPVQEIYYRFRPVGACDVWLRVTRPAGTEQPRLSGELNVYDARFTFERLPYPVERAGGKIRFGNDPVSGREMLEIVNITGHGEAGGANAAATLDVHGTIAPLDETAGADIHVSGRDLVGEPKLIASLPPLTRRAVLNFDAHETGLLPKFNGAFGCDVHRAIGLGRPWAITTRLTVRDGEGVFRGFPYPVKNVRGSFTVYDDHVDLPAIDMNAGGGTARLSGAINWTRHDALTGEPIVQPDLTLRSRDVPVNDDLIGALPASRRGFFGRLGLTGRVDVDGRVEPSSPDSEDPTVDLKVKLTQGRLRPPGVKLKLDDVTAAIRVKGERVDVDRFDATLAGAAVQGTAVAIDAAGGPRVAVEAEVSGLRADAAPLEALPADAAKAVRSLHAVGTVDLHLKYDAADAYRVTLRPVTLAVTPDLVPLPFDRVAGRVVVTPAAVRLERVTAKYADAPVSVDGTVDPLTGDADLSLAGRDLSVTPALVKALPAVLGGVATSLSLTGPVAFDCQKLVLRSAATKPAARPATTAFEATLWLQKCALRVAADMRDVVGKVTLDGGVRDGALQGLDGKIAVDGMTFAGRRVGRLSATLAKQPGLDLLRLSDVEARVAGGVVAGRIDTLLDKRDPRFALNLLVRGAKLADLTGDTAAPVDGTVNASLDMEGRWDDAATRRGRGDVLVKGKQMVRVPVVFGLMQVANLALPDRQPISQAAVRYTVEGQRIRMDRIDLRSTRNVMQGDGTLDFDKKTVELNLALADSAADALPLFGDLIKNARQDLLRLRIRGSLSGPSDGGQAFNVFNSTVDEVRTGNKGLCVAATPASPSLRPHRNRRSPGDPGSFTRKASRLRCRAPAGPPTRQPSLYSAMLYRTLGSTGLDVSVVGIGTWQFGGEWGKAFHQDEVTAMFDRGHELGLNLIDTAECYGDHLSEALVGRAIEGRRDAWVVATKFGHKFHGPFDRTDPRRPGDVIDQLTESLRALRTDHVDLLQYHSWGDDQFFDDDVLAALLRAKEQGLFRFLGNSVGSNANVKQVSASRDRRVEAIQIIYNRLDRTPEAACFPACREQNLGVLARVPLASGFLSGKYKPGTRFPEGDVRARQKREDVDTKLAEVDRIAREELPAGVPMSQWALAWCLKHDAVTSVIPGCKSVEQVEHNAAAAGLVGRA